MANQADLRLEGKKDIEFKKKPDLGIDLIDKSRARGYQPRIVLIDAGYGNNTSFLSQLEERKLKYLGGVANFRKVIIKKELENTQVIRLDELALIFDRR